MTKIETRSLVLDATGGLVIPSAPDRITFRAEVNPGVDNDSDFHDIPEAVEGRFGLRPLLVTRRLADQAFHAYLLMPGFATFPERTFTWQRNTIDEIARLLDNDRSSSGIDTKDQIIFRTFLNVYANEHLPRSFDRAA